MSPVRSQAIGGNALPTRRGRQRILRTRQDRACRRGPVRHHQRSRSVELRTSLSRPEGMSPTKVTKSRFLIAKFDFAQIAVGQPNVRFVPKADIQAAFGYYCWWARVLKFVEHD